MIPELVLYIIPYTLYMDNLIERINNQNEDTIMSTQSEEMKRNINIVEYRTHASPALASRIDFLNQNVTSGDSKATEKSKNALRKFIEAVKDVNVNGITLTPTGNCDLRYKGNSIGFINESLIVFNDQLLTLDRTIKLFKSV